MNEGVSSLVDRKIERKIDTLFFGKWFGELQN